MATSDVCRNLIYILAQYIHPIKAQFFVEQYCDKLDISIDNFVYSDLPKFIIYLARQRDDLPNINDRKFEKLLKNLMEFSNVEKTQVAEEKPEQLTDFLKI